MSQSQSSEAEAEAEAEAETIISGLYLSILQGEQQLLEIFIESQLSQLNQWALSNSSRRPQWCAGCYESVKGQEQY